MFGAKSEEGTIGVFRLVPILIEPVIDSLEALEKLISLISYLSIKPAMIRKSWRTNII